MKRGSLTLSESEVPQRAQHTLGCVEQYLPDFLRISLLHQDAYSAGETARLTQLSKGKVQGHLRLLRARRPRPLDGQTDKAQDDVA